MPTVSDDKMSSGTGAGTYSIAIDGIAEATKYFVRAYAINSEGTAYGTTESFTTAKTGVKTYKLGDLFEGGVIYHLNDEKTHGLAFADTSLGKMAWGCFGTAITGAVGFNIGTGARNTKDIVKECADNDCAARIVSGLTHKGFTGWHLPSRDELLTLHKNYTVAKVIGTGVYWTSSQNANNKTDMAQTVAVGTTGALVYYQKDIFSSYSAVAVKEF